MKTTQDILTMPHEQLEAIQLEGIKKTVITCYENVEFYHDLFEAAGFDPYAVETFEDLSKAPFTTKQDLRDNYPYNLFAVPMEDVREIHMSSGTTGVATVGGYTEHDLDLGRLLCPWHLVCQWWPQGRLSHLLWVWPIHWRSWCSLRQ